LVSNAVVSGELLTLLYDSDRN